VCFASRELRTDAAAVQVDMPEIATLNAALTALAGDHANCMVFCALSSAVSLLHCHCWDASFGRSAFG
jgi:hypothetical protein